MLKKVNRIEVKSKEKIREKHKPWILCIFNHECCVTCMTGCYSCQWNTKLEKKSRHGLCCCSWIEKLFYLFLVIAFCMSVFLLFIWIESSNEFHGFDWVVYLVTRHWYFWSLVLLSLFGILTVYSSSLLVLGFLLLWEGNEVYLHWCHKILTVLAIGICTFFMVVLFMYWKDRWLTFGLSLKIFAPYIHLSGIPMMVLLSWPVAFYLVHWEQEAAQVAIGLPFFLILLCLFVLPLGFSSPCIQEKDKLGPKPGIFGHRGAPMLGPENTMMAFEKAVENGAFGLESDVYLSCDGVPFLMHDQDLRRTTNIKEVMPDASNRSSHLFYWDVLSTLNAGSWFVRPELKPFHNMKPLSKADKEKARNQMIPKLSDLLELAQKEKKVVLFDLHGPPEKHPFRRTFIRQVVHVILDSKIEQHLIYWLSNVDRIYVKLKAPGFQQVGRLTPIETLRKQKIRIVNVDYKRLFYNGLRDYKAANITINLYLINEPWLFSLAWCSRINSVTTDDVQLLRQISHPSYFMTPSYYMFIWFLMDIVSAVFIFAIFSFHWWKESQKERDLDSTSTYAGSRTIILEKRKHEKQEVLNASEKPPPRVAEIPWDVEHLYPALIPSIGPTKGPARFQQSPRRKRTNESQPRKLSKTIKPPMPERMTTDTL